MAGLKNKMAALEARSSAAERQLAAGEEARGKRWGGLIYLVAAVRNCRRAERREAALKCLERWGANMWLESELEVQERVLCLLNHSVLTTTVAF